MSRREYEGTKLPRLQKKVVLSLARKGSQTINEIKTSIPVPAHYKPTWLAVKSLAQKGLVQEVGIKEYRGRQYPRFWLTAEGVLLALIEGVNPETLLKKTKEIFPENQILLYCLEIAPKLNLEVFEIGYLAVKAKGELELIDLATILFTQMQTGTSIRTFREAIEILKKYPKQYKSFKEQVYQMFEKFSRLKETI